MTRLPTKLFLQCVEELDYRENEGEGSWRNGLPACFEEARIAAGIPKMTMWLMVVESLVKSQCMSVVAMCVHEPSIRWASNKLEKKPEGMTTARQQSLEPYPSDGRIPPDIAALEAAVAGSRLKVNARSLAADWLSLPFHEQIGIAKAMELLTDNDNVGRPDINELIFTRAKEQDLTYNLAAHVMTVKSRLAR